MSDRFISDVAARRLLREIENGNTRARRARLRALGFNLDELEAEARRRTAADRMASVAGSTSTNSGSTSCP